MPAWLGVGENPLLCHRFLIVSSHGRSGERALWNTSVRELIPSMRVPPCWPNHLPKAPLPNAITLGMGGRISTYELGG